MSTGEDFTPLMLWVKGLPKSATFPVRSPTSCPVACYLRTISPGSAIFVYHEYLLVGRYCYRFREGHPMRRLIFGIDGRQSNSITRDEVLEVGRRIYQWEKRSLREQAEIAYQIKQARVGQLIAEWGW